MCLYLDKVDSFAVGIFWFSSSTLTPLLFCCGQLTTDSDNYFLVTCVLLAFCAILLIYLHYLAFLWSEKQKKASLKAVKICKTIKVGVVDKAISSHKNLKITVKVIKMVKCCRNTTKRIFL